MNVYKSLSAFLKKAGVLLKRTRLKFISNHRMFRIIFNFVVSWYLIIFLVGYLSTDTTAYFTYEHQLNDAVTVGEWKTETFGCAEENMEADSNHEQTEKMTCENEEQKETKLEETTELEVDEKEDKTDGEKEKVDAVSEKTEQDKEVTEPGNEEKSKAEDAPAPEKSENEPESVKEPEVTTPNTPDTTKDKTKESTEEPNEIEGNTKAENTASGAPAENEAASITKQEGEGN